MHWMDGVNAATRLSLPEIREAVQYGDILRNLIMNVARSQTGLHGIRIVDFTKATRKSNQRLQILERTCSVWCILCGICVLLCYVINNRNN